MTSGIPQGDTPFEYTALASAEREIRLITLLPDESGNKLTCNLTTYNWDPGTGRILAPKIGNADNGPGSVPYFYQSSSQVDSQISFDSKANENGEDEKQYSLENNALSYVALSYTWGDPALVNEIIINGQAKGVTENLWLALHNLRSYYFQSDNGLPSGNSCRTFWIDALCINQGDDREKSSQVGHMHLIYKHAKEVFIWLGVPAHNSDLAFDLMSQIHQTLRPDENDREEEIGLHIHASAVLGATEYILHKENASGWVALQRLLGRPWWSRAWTLQEFLLARRVVFLCGENSAPWPVLESAIMAAQEVDPFQEFHAFSAYFTRTFKHLMDSNDVYPSQAVLFFLRTSQDRLCTLPQDKIYSILGLVPPEVQLVMQTPDYTQPVQHVYTQMFQAYVQALKGLDIICCSVHTDTQDPALPSWAPDWSRRERMLPFGISSTNSLGDVLGWHCDTIDTYAPTFSQDAKSITVSGIHFGNIKGTKVELEIIPHLTKSSEHINSFEEPEYISLTWDFSDSLPELIREGGAILNYVEVNSYEKVTDLLLGVLLLRHEATLSKPSREEPEKTGMLEDLSQPYVERNLDEIEHRIRSVTANRTVAEIDSSELCLVPYWTEPGDFICQFVGCTVPLVLRRLDHGGFRFIGDCYMSKTTPQKMLDFLEEVIQGGGEFERFVLY